eukprot:gene7452-5250_t
MISNPPAPPTPSPAGGSSVGADPGTLQKKNTDLPLTLERVYKERWTAEAADLYRSEVAATLSTHMGTTRFRSPSRLSRGCHRVPLYRAGNHRIDPLHERRAEIQGGGSEEERRPDGARDDRSASQMVDLWTGFCASRAASCPWRTGETLSCPPQRSLSFAAPLDPPKACPGRGDGEHGASPGELLRFAFSIPSVSVVCYIASAPEAARHRISKEESTAVGSGSSSPSGCAPDGPRSAAALNTCLAACSLELQEGFKHPLPAAECFFSSPAPREETVVASADGVPIKGPPMERRASPDLRSTTVRTAAGAISPEPKQHRQGQPPYGTANDDATAVAGTSSSSSPALGLGESTSSATMFLSAAGRSAIAKTSPSPSPPDVPATGLGAGGSSPTSEGERGATTTAGRPQPPQSPTIRPPCLPGSVVRVEVTCRALPPMDFDDTQEISTSAARTSSSSGANSPATGSGPADTPPLPPASSSPTRAAASPSGGTAREAGGGVNVPAFPYAVSPRQAPLIHVLIVYVDGPCKEEAGGHHSASRTPEAGSTADLHKGGTSGSGPSSAAPAGSGSQKVAPSTTATASITSMMISSTVSAVVASSPSASSNAKRGGGVIQLIQEWERQLAREFRTGFMTPSAAADVHPTTNNNNDYTGSSSGPHVGSGWYTTLVLFYHPELVRLQRNTVAVLNENEVNEGDQRGREHAQANVEDNDDEESSTAAVAAAAAAAVGANAALKRKKRGALANAAAPATATAPPPNTNALLAAMRDVESYLTAVKTHLPHCQAATYSPQAAVLHIMDNLKRVSDTKAAAIQQQWRAYAMAKSTLRRAGGTLESKQPLRSAGAAAASSPASRFTPLGSTSSSTTALPRQYLPPSKHWSLLHYWRLGYDLVLHFFQFGRVEEGMKVLEQLFREYYNNSEDYELVQSFTSAPHKGSLEKGIRAPSPLSNSILLQLGRTPGLLDPRLYLVPARRRPDCLGYPLALCPGSDVLLGLLLVVSSQLFCTALLHTTAAEAASEDLQRVATLAGRAAQQQQEDDDAELERLKDQLQERINTLLALLKEALDEDGEKADEEVPRVCSREMEDGGGGRATGPFFHTSEARRVQQHFFLVQMHCSALRVLWPFLGFVEAFPYVWPVSPVKDGKKHGLPSLPSCQDHPGPPQLWPSAAIAPSPSPDRPTAGVEKKLPSKKMVETEEADASERSLPYERRPLPQPEPAPRHHDMFLLPSRDRSSRAGHTNSAAYPTSAFIRLQRYLGGAEGRPPSHRSHHRGCKHKTSLAHHHRGSRTPRVSAKSWSTPYRCGIGSSFYDPAEPRHWYSSPFSVIPPTAGDLPTRHLPLQPLAMMMEQAHAWNLWHPQQMIVQDEEKESMRKKKGLKQPHSGTTSNHVVPSPNPPPQEQEVSLLCLETSSKPTQMEEDGPEGSGVTPPTTASNAATGLSLSHPSTLPPTSPWRWRHRRSTMAFHTLWGSPGSPRSPVGVAHMRSAGGRYDPVGDGTGVGVADDEQAAQHLVESCAAVAALLVQARHSVAFIRKELARREAGCCRGSDEAPTDSIPSPTSTQGKSNNNDDDDGDHDDGDVLAAEQRWCNAMGELSCTYCAKELWLGLTVMAAEAYTVAGQTRLAHVLYHRLALMALQDQMTVARDGELIALPQASPTRGGGDPACHSARYHQEAIQESVGSQHRHHHPHCQEHSAEAECHNSAVNTAKNSCDRGGSFTPNRGSGEEEGGAAGSAGGSRMAPSLQLMGPWLALQLASQRLVPAIAAFEGWWSLERSARAVLVEGVERMVVSSAGAKWGPHEPHVPFISSGAVLLLDRFTELFGGESDETNAIQDVQGVEGEQTDQSPLTWRLSRYSSGRSRSSRQKPAPGLPAHPPSHAHTTESRKGTVSPAVEEGAGRADTSLTPLQHEPQHSRHSPRVERPQREKKKEQEGSLSRSPPPTKRSTSSLSDTSDGSWCSCCSLCRQSCGERGALARTPQQQAEDLTYSLYRQYRESLLFLLLDQQLHPVSSSGAVGPVFERDQAFSPSAICNGMGVAPPGAAQSVWCTLDVPGSVRCRCLSRSADESFEMLLHMDALLAQMIHCQRLRRLSVTAAKRARRVVARHASAENAIDPLQGFSPSYQQGASAAVHHASTEGPPLSPDAADVEAGKLTQKGGGPPRRYASSSASPPSSATAGSPPSSPNPHQWFLSPVLLEKQQQQQLPSALDPAGSAAVPRFSSNGSAFLSYLMTQHQHQHDQQQQQEQLARADSEQQLLLQTILSASGKQQLHREERRSEKHGSKPPAQQEEEEEEYGLRLHSTSVYGERDPDQGVAANGAGAAGGCRYRRAAVQYHDMPPREEEEEKEAEKWEAAQPTSAPLYRLCTGLRVGVMPIPQKAASSSLKRRQQTHDQTSSTAESLEKKQSTTGYKAKDVDHGFSAGAPFHKCPRCFLGNPLRFRLELHRIANILAPPSMHFAASPTGGRPADIVWVEVTIELLSLDLPAPPQLRRRRRPHHRKIDAVDPSAHDEPPPQIKSKAGDERLKQQQGTPHNVSSSASTTSSRSSSSSAHSTVSTSVQSSESSTEDGEYEKEEEEDVEEELVRGERSNGANAAGATPEKQLHKKRFTRFGGVPIAPHAQYGMGASWPHCRPAPKDVSCVEEAQAEEKVLFDVDTPQHVMVLHYYAPIPTTLVTQKQTTSVQEKQQSTHVDPVSIPLSHAPPQPPTSKDDQDGGIPSSPESSLSEATLLYDTNTKCLTLDASITSCHPGLYALRYVRVARCSTYPSATTTSRSMRSAAEIPMVRVASSDAFLADSFTSATSFYYFSRLPPHPLWSMPSVRGGRGGQHGTPHEVAEDFYTPRWLFFTPPPPSSVQMTVRRQLLRQWRPSDAAKKEDSEGEEQVPAAGVVFVAESIPQRHVNESCLYAAPLEAEPMEVAGPRVKDHDNAMTTLLKPVAPHFVMDVLLLPCGEADTHAEQPHGGETVSAARPHSSPFTLPPRQPVSSPGRTAVVVSSSTRYCCLLRCRPFQPPCQSVIQPHSSSSKANFHLDTDRVVNETKEEMKLYASGEQCPQCGRYPTTASPRRDGTERGKRRRWWSNGDRHGSGDGTTYMDAWVAGDKKGPHHVGACSPHSAPSPPLSPWGRATGRSGSRPPASDAVPLEISNDSFNSGTNPSFVGVSAAEGLLLHSAAATTPHQALRASKSLHQHQPLGRRRLSVVSGSAGGVAHSHGSFSQPLTPRHTGGCRRHAFRRLESSASRLLQNAAIAAAAVTDQLAATSDAPGGVVGGETVCLPPRSASQLANQLLPPAMRVGASEPFDGPTATAPSLKQTPSLLYAAGRRSSSESGGPTPGRASGLLLGVLSLRARRRQFVMSLPDASRFRSVGLAGGYHYYSRCNDCTMPAASGPHSPPLSPVQLAHPPLRRGHPLPTSLPAHGTGDELGTTPSFSVAVRGGPDPIPFPASPEEDVVRREDVPEHFQNVFQTSYPAFARSAGNPLQRLPPTLVPDAATGLESAGSFTPAFTPLLSPSPSRAGLALSFSQNSPAHMGSPPPLQQQQSCAMPGAAATPAASHSESLLPLDPAQQLQLHHTAAAASLYGSSLLDIMPQHAAAGTVASRFFYEGQQPAVLLVHRVDPWDLAHPIIQTIWKVPQLNGKRTSEGIREAVGSRRTRAIYRAAEALLFRLRSDAVEGVGRWAAQCTCPRDRQPQALESASLQLGPPAAVSLPESEAVVGSPVVAATAKELFVGGKAPIPGGEGILLRPSLRITATTAPTTAHDLDLAATRTGHDEELGGGALLCSAQAAGGVTSSPKARSPLQRLSNAAVGWAPHPAVSRSGVIRFVDAEEEEKEQPHDGPAKEESTGVHPLEAEPPAVDEDTLLDGVYPSPSVPHLGELEAEQTERPTRDAANPSFGGGALSPMLLSASLPLPPRRRKQNGGCGEPGASSGVWPGHVPPSLHEGMAFYGGMPLPLPWDSDAASQLRYYDRQQHAVDHLHTREKEQRKGASEEDEAEAQAEAVDDTPDRQPVVQYMLLAHPSPPCEAYATTAEGGASLAAPHGSRSGPISGLWGSRGHSSFSAAHDETRVNSFLSPPAERAADQQQQNNFYARCSFTVVPFIRPQKPLPPRLLNAPPLPSHPSTSFKDSKTQPQASSPAATHTKSSHGEHANGLQEGNEAVVCVHPVEVVEHPHHTETLYLITRHPQNQPLRSSFSSSTGSAAAGATSFRVALPLDPLFLCGGAPLAHGHTLPPSTISIPRTLTTNESNRASRRLQRPSSQMTQMGVPTNATSSQQQQREEEKKLQHRPRGKVVFTRFCRPSAAQQAKRPSPPTVPSGILEEDRLGGTSRSCGGAASLAEGSTSSQSHLLTSLVDRPLVTSASLGMQLLLPPAIQVLGCHFKPVRRPPLMTRDDTTSIPIIPAAQHRIYVEVDLLNPGQREDGPVLWLRGCVPYVYDECQESIEAAVYPKSNPNQPTAHEQESEGSEFSPAQAHSMPSPSGMSVSLEEQCAEEREDEKEDNVDGNDAAGIAAAPRVRSTTDTNVFFSVPTSAGIGGMGLHSSVQQLQSSTALGGTMRPQPCAPHSFEGPIGVSGGPMWHACMGNHSHNTTRTMIPSRCFTVSRISAALPGMLRRPWMPQERRRIVFELSQLPSLELVSPPSLRAAVETSAECAASAQVGGAASYRHVFASSPAVSVQAGGCQEHVSYHHLRLQFFYTYWDPAAGRTENNNSEADILVPQNPPSMSQQQKHTQQQQQQQKSAGGAASNDAERSLSGSLFAHSPSSASPSSSPSPPPTEKHSPADGKKVDASGPRSKKPVGTLEKDGDTSTNGREGQDQPHLQQQRPPATPQQLRPRRVQFQDDVLERLTRVCNCLVTAPYQFQVSHGAAFTLQYQWQSQTSDLHPLERNSGAVPAVRVGGDFFPSPLTRVDSIHTSQGTERRHRERENAAVKVSPPPVRHDSGALRTLRAGEPIQLAVHLTPTPYLQQLIRQQQQQQQQHSVASLAAGNCCSTSSFRHVALPDAAPHGIGGFSPTPSEESTGAVVAAEGAAAPTHPPSILVRLKVDDLHHFPSAKEAVEGRPEGPIDAVPSATADGRCISTPTTHNTGACGSWEVVGSQQVRRTLPCSMLPSPSCPSGGSAAPGLGSMTPPPSTYLGGSPQLQQPLRASAGSREEQQSPFSGVAAAEEEEEEAITIVFTVIPNMNTQPQQQQMQAEQEATSTVCQQTPPQNATATSHSVPATASSSIATPLAVAPAAVSPPTGTMSRTTTAASYAPSSKGAEGAVPVLIAQQPQQHRIRLALPRLEVFYLGIAQPYPPGAGRGDDGEIPGSPLNTNSHSSKLKQAQTPQRGGASTPAGKEVVQPILLPVEVETFPGYVYVTASGRLAVVACGLFCIFLRIVIEDPVYIEHHNSLYFFFRILCSYTPTHTHKTKKVVTESNTCVSGSFQQLRSLFVTRRGKPPALATKLFSPSLTKNPVMRLSANDLLAEAKKTLVDEVSNMRDDIKSTNACMATFFAIFCVGIVLVGNVVLLIAINFWLSIMPTDNLDHNSSQIAIQVVSMMFMLIFFTSFVVTFIGMYGVRPLIRTLVGSDRVGGPWYRLFLLFSSGATNAISSVLAVYAITYTPQFLQAILLCAIPFSAQAWTVIFIPLERKRNYVSVFFVGSFLFFIGGIFLASTKAFTGEHERASVPWTLIYLASSVVFGLWCVVQRLYLDAVVFKAVVFMPPAAQQAEGERSIEVSILSGADVSTPESIPAVWSPANALYDGEIIPSQTQDQFISTDEEDEGVPHQRHWAQQDVYDTAAKLVLLYVGVFFQTLVTFVCFPVDAIPWFGTSDTVGDAWAAFADSVNFIFDSWFNVRYGLLYSLGFAMSFIGCTYLNEHSPTLASVVLQLAGPVTSFMIVIVPKWNVYHDDNHVGEKLGGIVLLFVAAALYHFWDQHTSRLLSERLEKEQEEELQPEDPRHCGAADTKSRREMELNKSSVMVSRRRRRGRGSGCQQRQQPTEAIGTPPADLMREDERNEDSVQAELQGNGWTCNVTRKNSCLDVAECQSPVLCISLGGDNIFEVVSFKDTKNKNSIFSRRRTRERYTHTRHVLRMAFTLMCLLVRWVRVEVLSIFPTRNGASCVTSPGAVRRICCGRQFTNIFVSVTMKYILVFFFFFWGGGGYIYIYIYIFVVRDVDFCYSFCLFMCGCSFPLDIVVIFSYFFRIAVVVCLTRCSCSSSLVFFFFFFFGLVFLVTINIARFRFSILVQLIKGERRQQRSSPVKAMTLHSGLDSWRYPVHRRCENKGFKGRLGVPLHSPPKIFPAVVLSHELYSNDFRSTGPMRPVLHCASDLALLRWEYDFSGEAPAPSRMAALAIFLEDDGIQLRSGVFPAAHPEASSSGERDDLLPLCSGRWKSVHAVTNPPSSKPCRVACCKGGRGAAGWWSNMCVLCKDAVQQLSVGESGLTALQDYRSGEDDLLHNATALDVWGEHGALVGFSSGAVSLVDWRMHVKREGAALRMQVPRPPWVPLPLRNRRVMHGLHIDDELYENREAGLGVLSCSALAENYRAVLGLGDSKGTVLVTDVRQPGSQSADGSRKRQRMCRDELQRLVGTTAVGSIPTSSGIVDMKRCPGSFETIGMVDASGRSLVTTLTQLEQTHRTASEKGHPCGVSSSGMWGGATPVGSRVVERSASPTLTSWNREPFHSLSPPDIPSSPRMLLEALAPLELGITRGRTLSGIEIQVINVVPLKKRCAILTSPQCTSDVLFACTDVYPPQGERTNVGTVAHYTGDRQGKQTLKEVATHQLRISGSKAERAPFTCISALDNICGYTQQFLEFLEFGFLADTPPSYGFRRGFILHAHTLSLSLSLYIYIYKVVAFLSGYHIQRVRENMAGPYPLFIYFSYFFPSPVCFCSLCVTRLVVSLLSSTLKQRPLDKLLHFAF